MAKRKDSNPPAHSIDLHGLRPEQALRRLAQELHAARVAGRGRMRIVTGRGWGNLAQTPVLRGRVETWLRSAEGDRLGVKGVSVACKGGALDVRLADDT